MYFRAPIALRSSTINQGNGKNSIKQSVWIKYTWNGRKRIITPVYRTNPNEPLIIAKPMLSNYLTHLYGKSFVCNNVSIK